MLPEATLAHYRNQQAVSALTAKTVQRLWGRMGENFDQSWADIRPTMLRILAAGQLAAATASIGYVQQVLDETDQDAGDPAGVVQPAAFAGTASDGRNLGTLLDQAPIQAKAAIGEGLTVPAALQRGQTFLTMAALTQVSDASRGVIAADIGQRPQDLGYVRMLNPPSCPRCVMLAGKWFRYNQGFQRHPRCDCRHVPSLENRAGDFRTDPYLYFKSLGTTEQENLFGRSDARAIRDGADIYRVLNLSHRGLPVAGSKQAIRYGTPTKVTVDQIYRTAGTRANAIKLMREHGYITGDQVVGGNILGQAEGFGQLGKGGKARAASNAVTAARRTGVRDPLNRYTMTAAERRLYDAKVRLDAAERGVYLNSVGPNSADKFNRPQKPTASQLDSLRRNYATQLERLRGNTAKGIRPAGPSLQRLARALGIPT
jgi:hypothetical protein